MSSKTMDNNHYKGIERSLRTLDFKPADRVPIVGGFVRHPEFLADAAGVSLEEFWKMPRKTAIKAFNSLGADLILGLLLPNPGSAPSVYGDHGRQNHFNSPEDVRDYAASLPPPESVVSEFNADSTRTDYLREMLDGQRDCGEALWIPCGIHRNCAAFDYSGDFGYENYVMALTLYPEEMECLFALDAERAFLINQVVAEATRSEGLTPCIWTGTDACDNQGPFVNPEILERIYFPHLRHSLEPLHKADIKIIWHSDGNITPIVDQLIDAGVDGFQGFQEKVGVSVDLEKISEMRTKRGCKPILVGSISTTVTLPFGTPDDVRSEVDRCVSLAKRRGGGFILNSSSSIGPEVSKENIYAMFEYALKK